MNTSHVTNGKVIQNKTIGSGYDIHVSQGGKVLNVSFGADCALLVSSGGYASRINVTNNAFVSALNGAVIDDVDIVKGKATVFSGGIMNVVKVSSGTELIVQAGGTASQVNISSGAITEIFIDSGTNFQGTYNGSAINISGNSFNGLVCHGGMRLHLTSGIATQTKMTSNGYLYVEGQGSASRNTIEESGKMEIISGGKTSNTTILSKGTLTVSSNGYAAGNTVYGSALVYGGIVSKTTVYSGGQMRVSSAGKALDTTINSNGYMSISGGASASGLNILSGGTLTIYKDGAASSVTGKQGIINITKGSLSNASLSGCSVKISSGTVKDLNLIGGTVNLLAGSILGGTVSIKENGKINAADGTVIDFDLKNKTPDSGVFIDNLSAITGTPVYSVQTNSTQQAGSYHLAGNVGNFSGTISIKIEFENTSSETDDEKIVSEEIGLLTVNSVVDRENIKYQLVQNNSDLVLQIFDLTVPQNVLLLKGNFLVSSSTVINDQTLSGSGNNQMRVASGGKVQNTIINSSGSLYISAGGSASQTTINAGGALHVYSGAKVINTTVNRGGYLGIGNGAVAEQNTIGTYGSLTVWGGGAVKTNTINSRGAIILSKGAAANDTVINPGGALHVYSGASASKITVNAGGYLGIGNGAVATETTIANGGSLTVWGGGVVNTNTINSRGAITLSKGAVANDTVINPGGALHVYSGAKTSKTTVNAGGYLGIGNGATASGTTIANGGSLTVWGGGVVNTNTINYRGKIILSSGAVARNTTQLAGGELHIYRGAVASDSVIKTGAHLGIGGGGKVHCTSEEYGAKMIFYSGAVLSGENQWGGTVSVLGKLEAQGAFISLDITNRKGSDSAIIDNIGLIYGASWGINLAEDQQLGKYILARCYTSGYGADFSVQLESIDIGSVSLDEDLFYDNKKYDLNLEDGFIVLDISSTVNALSDIPDLNDPALFTASAYSAADSLSAEETDKNDLFKGFLG